MLGKCCSLSVALLAVVVGVLHSNQLSDSGSLEPFVETIAESLGRPDLIGRYPFLSNKNGFDPRMIPDNALQGKKALVVGGDTGTGWWTAYHLAKKGARVAITCGYFEDCYNVAKELNKAVGVEEQVSSRLAEIESLEKTRAFADRFLQYWTKLDIVVFTPMEQFDYSAVNVTEDELDLAFQAQFLKNVLIYKDLKSMIERSARVNGWVSIVTVTSSSHFMSNPNMDVDKVVSMIEMAKDKSRRGALSAQDYLDMIDYAQVLFAKYLDNKYAGMPIYSNMCSRGATFGHDWDLRKLDALMQLRRAERSLQEKLGKRLDIRGLAQKIYNFVTSTVEEAFWSPTDGALTETLLAGSPFVTESKIRGRYFLPVAKEMTHKIRIPDGAPEKLYDAAIQILKEKGFGY